MQCEGSVLLQNRKTFGSECLGVGCYWKAIADKCITTWLEYAGNLCRCSLLFRLIFGLMKSTGINVSNKFRSSPRSGVEQQFACPHFFCKVVAQPKKPEEKNDHEDCTWNPTAHCKPRRSRAQSRNQTNRNTHRACNKQVAHHAGCIHTVFWLFIHSSNLLRTKVYGFFIALQLLRRALRLRPSFRQSGI